VRRSRNTPIGTDLTISIVIPTYGREQILLDTITHHLQQAAELPQFGELIVIDQTATHEPQTNRQLQEWYGHGRIRWIRCAEPHLTRSMNRGLLEARSDLVLYTDDDVVPRSGWLQAHVTSHQEHPEAWAIVGQILQPREKPEDIPYQPRGGQLRRYMDFPFCSTRGQYIENAMAGNLSLKREKALQIGGFDENFPPPVASHFESEFAKRMVRSGGIIWFEPRASLRHLAAPAGGIRSKGSHLTSLSPHHGIGDCYFALRTGHGLEKCWYLTRKPFREVRTRFHLAHPWWIPLKLIGEIRALMFALALSRTPPRLIGKSRFRGNADKAAC
jgi:GT2 family glycosyltransferase